MELRKKPVGPETVRQVFCKKNLTFHVKRTILKNVKGLLHSHT